MDKLPWNQREKMISRIEGWFGTLDSLRWDLLSDSDLIKMYASMVHEKLINPIKE